MFASAFASGGELEARRGGRNHGLLWIALSLLVSALAVAVLHASALMLIGAQLVLFVAIGAVRASLAER